MRAVSDSLKLNNVAIEKELLPLLEVEFMNLEHEELLKMLATVQDLLSRYRPDSNLEQPIDTFLAEVFHRTRQHFLREEEKMSRYRFLPRGSHKAEHDQLLREMEEVITLWQKTRAASVLDAFFLVHVPAWFLQHANSMDLVSARFIAAHRQADASA